MRTLGFLWACVLAAGLAETARAELMLRVTDDDLAGAEAIVLGKITPESIAQGDNGMTVAVTVSDVLRGNYKKGETIRVLVQCRIGRSTRAKDAEGERDSPLPPPADPATAKIETVRLADEGRNGDGGALAPDLTQDALWFLWQDKTSGLLAVGRADHTQTARLAPYFQALIAKDPHGELLKLLPPGDPEVRRRALDRLAWAFRPEDALAAAALLSDGDAKVALGAAGLIAAVGDETALPIMRKALGHANASVRLSAIHFLCRQKDLSSLPAIAEAAKGFKDDGDLCSLAAGLPAMDSFLAVPLLLDLLDKDPTTPKDMWSSHPAFTASLSLTELTGIGFDLDAERARALWKAVSAVPPEALRRRTILDAIDSLTHPSRNVRFAALRCLVAMTGLEGHFRNSGLANNLEEWAETQRFWQAWAKDHLFESRREWLFAALKAQGETLSYPLAKEDVDRLVEILRQWAQPRGNARPGSTEEMPLKVQLANVLLEQVTGRVGVVPGRPLSEGLRRADGGRGLRWAPWWKANRDKAVLRPWPEEPKVAALDVRQVPDLLPPVPPLELSIKMKENPVPAGQRPVVRVEIKNVSSGPVTVCSRPHQFHYQKSGGNGLFGYGDFGKKQEDFVTLKPGESVRWEETRASFEAGVVTEEGKPPSLVGQLRYTLMQFPMAGRAFGLRAWRGSLDSADVTFQVKAP
jgi:hypothetical protein